MPENEAYNVLSDRNRHNIKNTCSFYIAALFLSNRNVPQDFARDFCQIVSAGRIFPARRDFSCRGGKSVVSYPCITRKTGK
jgi:hypothetical protein